MNKKKILLTGDTPTGKLHLGHWVGTLENRVALQNSQRYDCYFILADLHALSTHSAAQIQENTLSIVLDFLSVGIDPQTSTIFLQSGVPAICELTFRFSMLLSHARVMRNPTLKQELIDKQKEDNFSFGFALYPVGQVADILAFCADTVPVGEDQLPHLEMTHEVARRFNHTYCHVPLNTPDSQHVEMGGLFPIPEALLGKIKRLPGLDSPHKKMSKSSHNAIFLSDSPDTIHTKIMGMYTDPKRIKSTDLGTIENNPLWIFHDAFTQDQEWLQDYKERYQQGKVGDVECKKKLIASIVDLTEPFRKRRKEYENNHDALTEIIRQGTERACIVTEKTLLSVKEKMYQIYA